MDTPEIQGASDSILRRRRLTELPVISPDAPLEMFDGEDRDVLVQGDLAFLHVVRSEGSVLIQGSIRGSAAQPIRVEATGDVVVTGAVHYGQLTGKRILIGGRICHSQHTSSQSVSIGSTLETGRVVTGAYENDQRRIESCRLTL